MSVLSDEELEELAKSVLQGKPTEKCPIPFSYVQAAFEFARAIVQKKGES